MRVALQTWGSDGDIRPFIALGAGLVRRGHRVALCIGSIDDKEYRPLCRSLGLECVLAPERSGAELSSWMRRFGRTRNSLRMLRLLHEHALFPAFEEMSAAAQALVADADLAVGHFLAAPLRIAAEQRGVPYATVAFWPGLVPDPGRPPERLFNAGRFSTGLWWRLAATLIDRAVGRGYRDLYQRHSAEMASSTLASWYSPRLNLLACSKLFWPDASEEGAHRFCGPLLLPAEAEREPLPAHVEEFLARGEPPAFLTLGATSQVDPEGCAALLVEAARLSGLRCIVQLPPGAPPPEASERLCFVERLSHAAVFPHCSAILHHGGAGTTHAALRAGRPAVVAGFMHEQLSWGMRLEKLGAGRGVFHYPFVKPARVAAALSSAARDPRLLARAEELAAQLRKEDGVSTAVRLLEGAASGEGREQVREVGGVGGVAEQRCDAEDLLHRAQE